MELKNFQSKSIDEVISYYKTSESGLSSKRAEQLLEKNGKNKLVETKRKNWFMRFLDQMKDVMIIVLLIASLVSGILAVIEKKYIDLVDSGIILLIVIINAIIGLIQENKANNAMEALKNMNKPYAKVLRDGEIIKIKSEDIVVGDIVVLEAGDIVPADIRLIDSASLKIEESALTGESVPSEKNHNVILSDTTPLGDRKNMVYSSGVVAYGRGKGVVVAVGMDTEVGKIATMLNESKENQTPLQGQLAKTAKLLSILVLGIALVIFVASIVKNGLTTESISNSFMTAVAIAVAAIPEGLPAVVTIVLAIGVKRMSEKKAIVKNLPAVETLGCCQVICSDKTGTLTINKMTVKQLFTISQGLFYKSESSHNSDCERTLIEGLVLCNDTVENSDDTLVGDPTETALVAYAKLIGTNIKILNKEAPRLYEIPFDSKRKLMTTLNSTRGKNISYTKGAVDVILNRCTHIMHENEIRPITEDDILVIKQANKQMADSALRVLGLAIKTSNLTNKANLEEGLTFVGIVGMIDPPRKEVKAAVATCNKAGMRAIMITGDHLDTAVAIAKEIGIYKKDSLAITGAELDKLSDKEFHKNLHRYSVFARVSPENKVRIVQAFKSFNMIVAMTGDGVNDAPSIKIADVGVGMGITGTDVSKGAADMVLADDNFATIVAAVEEGRKVYSNIQKAVKYLLSANIAEVLCLFISTIFLLAPGQEFLSAVMILWINLVTDSFPALALGCEKADKDIMDYPPRKSGSSLFAGNTGKDIIIQGLMQTILTMLSYCIGHYVMGNHEIGVTMAFITLALIQLFHSYNTKSNHSLFSRNPLDNKLLNIAFLVGIIFILIPTLIPFIAGFFGAVPLTLTQWIIAVGCSIAIIPMVEIQKIIENKKVKRK
ncbi:MAG: calcium-translocating P-type ATPase, PMCA-type [Clostridiales bacterium]|nr:calcium-translocating P-type ATPase, PMCA-type [Clostridiales bacterium]